MSHTFCPCQLRLRSPIRCMFATRFAVPLSSSASQFMRTCQNRCRTFPSLIFLVPSLRRRDHTWPSFPSLRSENETANVADDGLACFDSCFVCIVQDGLEGVMTRSFFGQFICPFIASGREATSLIQLGLLRLEQVRFAFRLPSRCGLHLQRLGSIPRSVSTRQRVAFALLCTISVLVPGVGAPLHSQRRTSLLAQTR